MHAISDSGRSDADHVEHGLGLVAVLPALAVVIVVIVIVIVITVVISTIVISVITIIIIIIMCWGLGPKV